MIGILKRLPVYHEVTLLTHSHSDSKTTMSDPSKRRKLCVSSELERVDGSETVKTWYFAGTKKAYESLDDFHDAVLQAQRTGKAPYWRLVIVHKDVAQETVQLICKQCCTVISARNPADSAKKHFERKDGAMVCKSAQRIQGRIESALQQASARTTSGPSFYYIIESNVALSLHSAFLNQSSHSAEGRTQRTLAAHVVSQAQQEAFEAMFAQFMYVTLTPLHRLDSPELKTPLALLGAVYPSRKKVAGPLLDRAYNEAVSKSIARIKECSAVCVTMDGWKKRAAEHGTPIITVIILLPDGNAQFWKVRCPLINQFYINACILVCDCLILAAEAGYKHCGVHQVWGVHISCLS
jgi:hypothetical protein